MFGNDANNDNFEEMLRTIAREVGKSVERAAEAASQVDIDEIAGAIGVDPARAREWVDGAVEWLRDQTESLADDVPLWGTRAEKDPEPKPESESRTPSGESSRRTGPHPLDLPTPDQGMALAALDSGRWTVEPGSHALVDHGEGPGPSDALGLVGELRARDWIAADGELTQSGRRALSRWLEAAGTP